MNDRPVQRVQPPAFLADPDIKAVLAALPHARLVGGSVRDVLSGRPVADIDLATPDGPEAVMAALQAAGLRAIPTGIDHGTVTAVSGGKAVEITSLRRDIETDGRHALIAFTDDWREDAARRDFTINAMSMTPDGAVFDYFDGLADLAAGRLRFVGDPATRIAEDYLRILRFFRFHARYARERPDPAALAAIRAGVPALAGLSAERVWSELSRILATPDPEQALLLMRETGVLGAVMTEGFDLSRLLRLLAAGAPPDPVLRVASLLAGDADAFADRLRLSGAERDRLAALRQWPWPTPADDDAALRRLLADTPRAVLVGRAWLADDGKGDWPGLRARLAAMPQPVFPLEGRDVVAAGIAPGPEVGRLLRAVRSWWLAGGCEADGADCRRQLASLPRG